MPILCRALWKRQHTHTHTQKHTYICVYTPIACSLWTTRTTPLRTLCGRRRASKASSSLWTLWCRSRATSLWRWQRSQPKMSRSRWRRCNELNSNEMKIYEIFSWLASVHDGGKGHGQRCRAAGEVNVTNWTVTRWRSMRYFSWLASVHDGGKGHGQRCRAAGEGNVTNWTVLRWRSVRYFLSLASVHDGGKGHGQRCRTAGEVNVTNWTVLRWRSVKYFLWVHDGGKGHSQRCCAAGEQCNN